jgi:hypothetical protein
MFNVAASFPTCRFDQTAPFDVIDGTNRQVGKRAATSTTAVGANVFPFYRDRRGDR